MSNLVIYDRIWESKKLAACSLKAALAYPWLYLIADDFGRFEYLPRVIWGRAFGAREDVSARDVDRWLGEYQAVGLLKVYEAGGLKVGTWTRFVGPPPSKRSASLYLNEDGVDDSKGFKGKSRFHSGDDSLPYRSPETGNGKRETGNRKLEAGGRTEPPASPPASDDDLPALKDRALDLAQEIARREGTDARLIIQTESRTTSGKFIDRLEGCNRPAWLTTTIAKLEARLAELDQPPTGRAALGAAPTSEPLSPEQLELAREAQERLKAEHDTAGGRERALARLSPALRQAIEAGDPKPP